MKEAILSITIEKIKDGAFKDSIKCSGTEVEVLGMIAKFYMMLTKIKGDIVEGINIDVVKS